MSSRSGKSGKKSSLKSTFTYYIPAPPSRKTGYREREFDKIMRGILSSGYDIEELHTHSVGGSDNAGLYIVALLKASSSKVAKLDESQDIQENFKLSHSHSSPDIILEEDSEDDL